MNVPAPLLMNETVPVGDVVIPAGEVSVTAAVHVVDEPTVTDCGTQLTVVVVVRLLTVTVKMPELAE